MTRLVVTNDDGFDSPGIGALVHAAGDFGETIVVAPTAAQSGVGHQLTVDAPIHVERVGDQGYRVDGKPADCARLALTELAPGADWLLAGINHGANLGADVYTSGTVAAAREAALLGCRALALSQYIGRERTVDWTVTARRAASVLRILLARDLPAGHFWNINLPHPPGSAIELPIVFCGLDTRPHGVRYRRDGGDAFIYAGDYHARPRQVGRDVDVCLSGRVAVTLVTLEIAAEG
jgi:5'-nucleotidase